MHELPAEIWEQFLASGDESALIELLAKPLMRMPRESVSYPESHRIGDVSIGGKAYRVIRLVDLDDHQERLFIKPTDVVECQLDGVPYHLQGAALRRWIRDEIEAPTKGPQSWGNYVRGSESRNAIGPSGDHEN